MIYDDEIRRKKKRRRIFYIAVTLVYLFGLLYVYYYIIVRPDLPYGIDNYNGEYELIETTNKTRMFALFSVISKEDNELIYTSEDWYGGTQDFECCWATDNNDIFVYTGDTGTYVYIYEGTGWSKPYDIDDYDEESQCLILIYEDDDLYYEDDEQIMYSIDHVPQRILDELSL